MQLSKACVKQLHLPGSVNSQYLLSNKLFKRLKACLRVMWDSFSLADDGGISAMHSHGNRVRQLHCLANWSERRLTWDSLLPFEPTETKIMYYGSAFFLNVLHIQHKFIQVNSPPSPRNLALCVTFVENVSTVRMSKQITCSCILDRDHLAVHIVVKLLHSSQIWAPI
jgi:hypothetical protein